MSKLKQRFENACNEYVDIFCEKQGLKNEGWVNDEVGEIICCSSYFFSLRDIRHDIDTNQPKDHIFDWYFANLENPDKAINYDSYTKGLRIENISDVVEQSEQLGDCNFCNNKAVKRDEDGFEFCTKCLET